MSRLGSSRTLVYTSGGPSPVINYTTAKLVRRLSERGFGDILGAENALDGVLNRKFFDLKCQPPEVMDGAAQTPGMMLGTKRKEPNKDECQQFLDVLKEYKIGYAFFNGGDNTARTAYLISESAKNANYGVVCVHIPKTIDNDIDPGPEYKYNFTPGFPSAAWYVANVVGAIDRDNKAMPGVHILVTMGKDAGYLAAASTLAKRDERDAPHKVFVPEKIFEMEQLYAAVDDALAKFGRAIIVASEGIRIINRDGKQVLLSETLNATISSNGIRTIDDEHNTVVLAATKGTDGFGGLTLSGTSILGDYLQKRVEAHIPKVKRIRAGTFGYEQRVFPFYTQVDRKGAEIAAEAGVYFAMQGQTGSVALRPYDKIEIVADMAPLERVGNGKRQMPPEFLAEGGCGINVGAYKAYAMPLVGEENLVKKVDLLPVYFTLPGTEAGIPI